MNTQNTKQFKRRNIELRSEKTRSIVGPIPPLLIRYGTIIISFSLTALICISAFIPYRKVVYGNIVIDEIPIPLNEYVLVKAQLKFSKNEHRIYPEKCKIILVFPNHEIKGIIFKYNPQKATEKFNETYIQLLSDDLKSIDSSEIDFKLILSETTILKQFLYSIKI